MQVTLIHLEDRLRAGVSNVIMELQEQARLRVMMLTGDHESSAAFNNFAFCRAVVDHCIDKDLPSVSVESFEYFPGRGLTATLNNMEVQAFRKYILILIKKH